MPRNFIKIALLITSISPILFTYGALYLKDNKVVAFQLFGLAIVLAFLCKLILMLFKRKLPTSTIQISSVKIADQQVFAFIIAYLLPVVAKTSIDIDINVTACVLILILITIYQSDSYHFNPLLSIIFRYHFYEVTTSQNITYVLLTKKEIINTRKTIKFSKISEYMILDVGE